MSLRDNERQWEAEKRETKASQSIGTREIEMGHLLLKTSESDENYHHSPSFAMENLSGYLCSHPLATVAVSSKPKCR